MKTINVRKKLMGLVAFIFMIVGVVQGVGVNERNLYAAALDPLDPIVDYNKTPIQYKDEKIMYKTGGDLSINPKDIPVRKKVVILMDSSINALDPTQDQSPFKYAIFSDGDFGTTGQKLTIHGDVRTDADAKITAGDFEIKPMKDDKGNDIGGNLEYLGELDASADGSGEAKYNPKHVTQEIPIDVNLANEYLTNTDKYNLIQFDLENKTINNEKITDISNALEKYGYKGIQLKEQDGGWAIINNNSGKTNFDLSIPKAASKSSEGKDKINVFYFKPSIKISISGMITGNGVIIGDNNVSTEGEGVNGEILLYSLKGNIHVSNGATTKNAAVIYAPYGDVLITGQDFNMEGSIVAKQVKTTTGKFEIKWDTVAVMPEIINPPSIPQNIKKAAKDFVDNINNNYVSMNFIPYRADANSATVSTYTNPDVYTVDDKETLKNIIDATNSDDKVESHRYANLGDGLRRAYYILKADPSGSKSVIVLSSGAVKGWTERDNTTDDSQPPYKTATGLAEKFGDKSNKDNLTMAYDYAKLFSEKLVGEGIDTHFVKLETLDKDGNVIIDDTLRKLAGETNVQFHPEKDKVPEVLQNSINQKITKQITKIYLKSIEIKEDYTTPTENGMKIVGFDKNGVKHSDWKKNSDKEFAGLYSKHGEIDIDPIKGTFTIDKEEISAVVNFSKPGPIKIPVDNNPESKRCVIYSYVLMDNGKFVDDDGNYSETTDIDKVDESFIKDVPFPLPLLDFDVQDKKIEEEIWCGAKDGILEVPNADDTKYEYKWNISDNANLIALLNNNSTGSKITFKANDNNPGIVSGNVEIRDINTKDLLGTKKFDIVVKQLAISANSLSITISGSEPNIKSTKGNLTLSVLPSAQELAKKNITLDIHKNNSYQWSYDNKFIDVSDDKAESIVVTGKQITKDPHVKLSAIATDRNTKNSKEAVCIVKVNGLPGEPIISIKDMIVGDKLCVGFSLGSVKIVNPDKFDEKTKKVEVSDEYKDQYTIKEWKIVDDGENDIKKDKKKETIIDNGLTITQYRIVGEYVDLVYDVNLPQVCKVIAKKKSPDKVYVKVDLEKIVELDGEKVPMSKNINFKVNTDIQ